MQTDALVQNQWTWTEDRSFWSKWMRKYSARLGIFLLLFLMLSCFLPTIWTSIAPDAQGDILDESNLPPSTDHPFGTDKFARDVLSRVLYGGRVSLSIALGTVALSMVIGVIYGAVSGYSGSKLDAIMMRLLDLLLAFPVVILAIAIAALYQPHYLYLIPLLAFTGWMETARIVRAEVLSVKEREFVMAAECLGFRKSRILFAHIIPNAIAPALITIPLKIGDTVLLESALSFLGVGVQPPVPSWGNMINDGKSTFPQEWWVVLFAGIFLIVTVSAFNWIGESLHELLHPNSNNVQ
ncbi:ABC transporter permease [candidate division KSB1 bacterium]|nr:ABC transporter permease [candidate division KSB1 bacterium]